MVGVTGVATGGAPRLGGLGRPESTAFGGVPGLAPGMKKVGNFQIATPPATTTRTTAPTAVDRIALTYAIISSDTAGVQSRPPNRGATTGGGASDRNYIDLHEALDHVTERRPPPLTS